MGEPSHLTRADWARDPRHWKGRFEGRDHGTGVTVLFFSSEEVGDGPVLHKHPYDEVFILRMGRALFNVGEAEFEAKAGDIVIAPAETPHRFEVLGPGRLETTDIHLSDHLIQTDLA